MDTQTPSRRSGTFSDQPPPAEFIRFSTPKVCPACLREADYYRRYWDLLPFTSCPAHGVVLIDSCPGCGRRLSWVRKKVSVCRCGYDWRTNRPATADADGLEVSRHALRLCLQSSENPRTRGDGIPGLRSGSRRLLPGTDLTGRLPPLRLFRDVGTSSDGKREVSSSLFVRVSGFRGLASELLQIFAPGQAPRWEADKQE